MIDNKIKTQKFLKLSKAWIANKFVDKKFQIFLSASLVTCALYNWQKNIESNMGYAVLLVGAPLYLAYHFKSKKKYLQSTSYEAQTERAREKLDNAKEEVDIIHQKELLHKEIKPSSDNSSSLDSGTGNVKRSKI